MTIHTEPHTAAGPLHLHDVSLGSVVPQEEITMARLMGEGEHQASAIEQLQEEELRRTLLEVQIRDTRRELSRAFRDPKRVKELRAELDALHQSLDGEESLDRYIQLQRAADRELAIMEYPEAYASHKQWVAEQTQRAATPTQAGTAR
jgi:hypothetical protein